MLRRVARALRLTMFAIGVLLLAWLPLSNLFVADIYVSWRGGAIRLLSHNATLQVFTWSDSRSRDVSARLFDPDLHKLSGGVGWEHGSGAWPTHFTWELWPSGSRLVTPLWQVCVLLMAIPLLPFVWGKGPPLFRRQRRGFPVEPALSTPLPRAGEVPSERSE